MNTTINKIVIAIDGHSSTGKSTIAKQLASELQYIYVDTGAMYRSVALYALRHTLKVNGRLDIECLVQHLPKITIDFRKDSGGKVETYLNDENVEDEIRTLKVSNLVSHVAAVPQVRIKLVEQQQVMGQQKGVVMDGRDIGTVVFPDAELKLFMTASANVRAQRRYDELMSKGHRNVSYVDVLDNINQRDYLDATRKDSPLKKAEDAFVIDNSKLSRTEQFTYIMELVSNCIS